MTIFTKDYSPILGWGFGILIVIYLAELSYLYCILERKEYATERRVRQYEQTIATLTTRLDAVKQDLLNTQIEYLAKNRAIRREVRIFQNRFHKHTDDYFRWSGSVYRELRAVYKHAKMLDLEDDQSQLQSEFLRKMNMRLYRRDTDRDITEPE
jgi:hypothetical protein